MKTADIAAASSTPRRGLATLTAVAPSIGPTMNNSSCAVASTEYAVRNAGPSTIRGQAARSVCITGGTSAPAITVSAGRNRYRPAGRSAIASNATLQPIPVTSSTPRGPRRSAARDHSGPAIAIPIE
ncbi:autotransporter adhesin [Kribbella aluminosa]|uniref:Autotransporter adhesin n=1 Tax=Kribbella aluminosa TaxID=416017 RepID=A0ABS4UGG3_9ACTN|nr:autotransporter adhesin [Kribbella aluminosa]